jgi:hypothetical protein
VIGELGEGSVCADDRIQFHWKKVKEKRNKCLHTSYTQRECKREKKCLKKNVDKRLNKKKEKKNKRRSTRADAEVIMYWDYLYSIDLLGRIVNTRDETETMGALSH